METFTWGVSLGTSKATTTRLLQTQYGDGYSQRLGDGINNVVDAFDVTIKASSLSIAGEIETFLKARAGVEAFAWTPPHASAAIAVTCESWRRQDRTNSSVISATFKQVFEP